MTTTKRTHVPSRSSLGAAIVLLLLSIGGCASTTPSATGLAAATRPDDIVCPHCQMKSYTWDSHDRHGVFHHHQAHVMECPECVVRTTGIWTLIGESHTCKCCSQGAERCPMCRAADESNHGGGK